MEHWGELDSVPWQHIYTYRYSHIVWLAKVQGSKPPLHLAGWLRKRPGRGVGTPTAVFRAGQGNLHVGHPLHLRQSREGAWCAAMGEIVCAFVARQPGSDLEAAEVIEHCRDLIAGYKKPRAVEFVEALPRNSTGKVDKAEIQRILRERHGADGRGLRG